MMNGNLKACGLIAVVIAYATYFIGNAIQGTEAVDGILFGTVIGAIVYLATGTYYNHKMTQALTTRKLKEL